MPAKYFKCPKDESVIAIKSCLRECKHGCRCLSLRTLRAVAEQRVWAGEPSTTQLLKGTREAYLEITCDYAIDPMQELFRVLGSKAHAYLEDYTDNELTEERLHDEIASGQFDFYDPASMTLYDTKTWGSYKVMRALGYKQEKVQDGVYKKSGKWGKAGDPKYVNQTVQGEPDMLDTEIQLNHYRMMLEDAGFPVKEMFVEAIVRDGGTHIAVSRGIEQNGYLIPVKMMDNCEVKKFLTKKRNDLIFALVAKTTPKMCSDEERWDGRKCDRFCRVAQFCKLAELNEQEKEAMTV